jgi:hypothetical protein
MNRAVGPEVLYRAASWKLNSRAAGAHPYSHFKHFPHKQSIISIFPAKPMLALHCENHAYCYSDQ